MFDLTKTEVLPDSRLRSSKGAISGPGGWWVPVFCAICGKPYGYVPEENCSFACWLCDDCSEIHGAVFSGMLMPDEVFWERVRLEQLDKYRRLLTPGEIQAIADEGEQPLAKLLKEGA